MRFGVGNRVFLQCSLDGHDRPLCAHFGLTGKDRRYPEADTTKLRAVVATLSDQGNISVYPSPMEGTRLDHEWDGSAHTKTQEFRVPFWD
jgi:hypothetical protein